MQHGYYTDNVNDNTDTYFLLINEKLLNYICFTGKQQLHILYQISHSAYFSTHFQLLLV